MNKINLILITLFVLQCEKLEPMYGRHGGVYSCKWEDDILETYPTLANALFHKKQYMESKYNEYRNCRIYETKEVNTDVK
jgi:hypothetical protein